MTTQDHTTATRGRILTGDRPTGRLHLGHLVGSLNNRVRLQSEHDTILIIADLHMLTTKPSREAIDSILGCARGIVLDYLAAGIDPASTTIYLQSGVPEVYELNTLLMNLVSVSRLSRLPNLKDMARAARFGDDTLPFGLLGYPVLQAADILLPKATLVPIGADNLAQVEIAREIARRFNHLYGAVFPEPSALVGEVPTLIGTDGKGKMSKSAGNAILLSDDRATVRKKVRGMFTDPNRIHANIPGRVEGNPVFEYHKAFNDDQGEVEALAQRYRAGSVGDGEVKDRLVEALERFMAPLRARMATYESQPGLVDDILLDGTARMREIARETMKEVRGAMGMGRAMVRLERAAEKRAKRRR